MPLSEAQMQAESTLEQAETGADHMARMAAAYYVGLTKNGVADSLARTLTRDWHWLFVCKMLVPDKDPSPPMWD